MSLKFFGIRGYTEDIAIGSNPLVFVSAGEASGDAYGAALISELRRRLPNTIFNGLGGMAMEAAGQDRVVRAEDVAHMGLTEVVRHAPYIYLQYRKLLGSIQRQKPDVAVLIDFPDVNFRLAKHLRRAGVPVIWFVSPQLWAWKRGRLRWVQQRVHRMMVIFPFEEPFYRARGVQADFVGHPLARLEMPKIAREEFAARYRLDPKKQWVAMLPGSRWKELEANLPIMAEAAAKIGNGFEYVLPVASTLDTQRVSAFLVRLGARVPAIHLVNDAREALFFARASVVASGTATVQALTIGNPFVVVYRVSKLTFAVAKQLVKYPKEVSAEVDTAGNLPVGMVNLIAGRWIVPELLNEQFTGEKLAAALRLLLGDTPQRQQMIADLAEARARLLPQADMDPIARVADAVLGFLATGT